MSDNQFDWIIAGGGIAGICVAEILSRGGKSVLLLEKNSFLASETSKIFHEWLHTGSLYTLVPDKLLTTRFLLGAIDDLLEYYQSFMGMNLQASENGLKINRKGWFNDENILFRYRNRKHNLIWMLMISHSSNVVEKIKSHDWLRRRAGALYGESRLSRRNWIDKIPEIIRTSGRYFDIKSPDITMNSRKLINDILKHAVANGLVIKTEEKVVTIKQLHASVSVETNNGNHEAKNLLLCSPDMMALFFNKTTKTSYAPIAVVEGVHESASSFVELDYYTKNCINLLKKDNGIGQAGGISVSRQTDIQPYMDYVIKCHKKINPEIKVIDQYVGLKKEIVSSGQERNYLYHINKHDKNIWSMVLGKFTLAFSAAPEFFRRVYHKNPKKIFEVEENGPDSECVSKTSWQEIVDKQNRGEGI